MKNILKKLAISGTALGMVSFATPAFAATYDFCFFGDFSCTVAPDGTKTDTAQYGKNYMDSTSSESISVFGYDDYSILGLLTGFNRTIVEHNRAVNDLGLGIKGGTGTDELDNMNGKEFFLVDLQSFDPNYANFDWSIMMSSVDGTEEFAIYNSSSFLGITNLVGGLYPLTLVASGDAADHNMLVDLGSGLDRYLFVIESSNTSNADILLRQLTASTVPVPSVLGLMGLSLAGLGFVARRRK
jgi:hypothetical protein